MADRVLPSRTNAAEILQGDPCAREPAIRWLFDAYVSRRLVDREAIDYEAARREWHKNHDLPRAIRAALGEALPVGDGIADDTAAMQVWADKTFGKRSGGSDG